MATQEPDIDPRDLLTSARELLVDGEDYLLQGAVDEARRHAEQAATLINLAGLDGGSLDIFAAGLIPPLAVTQTADLAGEFSDYIDDAARDAAQIDAELREDATRSAGAFADVQIIEGEEVIFDGQDPESYLVVETPQQIAGALAAARGDASSRYEQRSPDGRYSDDEWRALRHVVGRTRSGQFASPLYDWSDERWRAATAGLVQRGVIVHGPGRVADEPSVSGGWRIAQDNPEGREAMALGAAPSQTLDRAAVLEGVYESLNVVADSLAQPDVSVARANALLLANAEALNALGHPAGPWIDRARSFIEPPGDAGDHGLAHVVDVVEENVALLGEEIAAGAPGWEPSERLMRLTDGWLAYGVDRELRDAQPLTQVDAGRWEPAGARALSDLVREYDGGIQAGGVDDEVDPADLLRTTDTGFEERIADARSAASEPRPGVSPDWDAKTLRDVHQALLAARSGLLEGDMPRVRFNVSVAAVMSAAVGDSTQHDLLALDERISFGSPEIAVAERDAIIMALEGYANGIAYEVYPDRVHDFTPPPQSPATVEAGALRRAQLALVDARHALLTDRLPDAGNSIEGAALLLEDLARSDIAAAVRDLGAPLADLGALGYSREALEPIADGVDHQAFIVGRDARALEGEIDLERERDPWELKAHTGWRRKVAERDGALDPVQDATRLEDPPRYAVPLENAPGAPDVDATALEPQRTASAGRGVPGSGRSATVFAAAPASGRQGVSRSTPPAQEETASVASARAAVALARTGQPRPARDAVARPPAAQRGGPPRPGQVADRPAGYASPPRIPGPSDRHPPRRGDSVER